MSGEVTRSEINTGKFCAISSYLIIGLFWYAFDKNQQQNKFAQFHAKEALLMILGIFIVNGLRPYIGLLADLAGVVVMAVGLVAFYGALTGRMMGMPLLSDFAQKFNI